MKDIETMAETGSTRVPASFALQVAGFTVGRRPKNGNNRWKNVSTDMELMSEHSLCLLDLAAIRKSRGIDWRATDNRIEYVLHEFGFTRESA